MALPKTRMASLLITILLMASLLNTPAHGEQDKKCYYCLWPRSVIAYWLPCLFDPVQVPAFLASKNGGAPQKYTVYYSKVKEAKYNQDTRGGPNRFGVTNLCFGNFLWNLLFWGTMFGGAVGLHLYMSKQFSSKKHFKSTVDDNSNHSTKITFVNNDRYLKIKEVHEEAGNLETIYFTDAMMQMLVKHWLWFAIEMIIVIGIVAVIAYYRFQRKQNQYRLGGKLTVDGKQVAIRSRKNNAKARFKKDLNQTRAKQRSP